MPARAPAPEFHAHFPVEVRAPPAWFITGVRTTGIFCRPTAETELHEYFAGTRTRFDVPLDTTGSGFQQQAWNGLLLIPRHRVVGADGKLTGYGGGLGRKQWLLSHEQRRAPLQLL